MNKLSLLILLPAFLSVTGCKQQKAPEAEETITEVEAHEPLPPKYTAHYDKSVPPARIDIEKAIADSVPVNLSKVASSIEYFMVGDDKYPITDVVLPARLMKMMGAKVLFLTNASGGINPAFHAGSLMLIQDHISLFAPNPLIGPNIEELGTRFPDMSHVYDEDLQGIIRETAKENDIELFEGVYAQLTGPSFESPAEIQMLYKMGASAVGMSTVVEAIAANHMGMKICGVSCVSNLAAGMNSAPLTHEEVQEAANAVAPKFEKLLVESITKFKAFI